MDISIGDIEFFGNISYGQRKVSHILKNEKIRSIGRVSVFLKELKIICNIEFAGRAFPASLTNF